MIHPKITDSEINGTRVISTNTYVEATISANIDIGGKFYTEYNMKSYVKLNVTDGGIFVIDNGHIYSVSKLQSELSVAGTLGHR